MLGPTGRTEPGASGPGRVYRFVRSLGSRNKTQHTDRPASRQALTRNSSTITLDVLTAGYYRINTRPRIDIGRVDTRHKDTALGAVSKRGQFRSLPIAVVHSARGYISRSICGVAEFFRYIPRVCKNARMYHGVMCKVIYVVLVKEYCSIIQKHNFHRFQKMSHLLRKYSWLVLNEVLTWIPYARKYIA